MDSSNSTKRIIRSLFSVSGIIIIGKVLGFVKQAVSAGYFGATALTDIISLSEGVVMDIDYLLTQTLITSFIPVYIAAKTRSETEDRRFVSNTLKLFFLISMTLFLFIEMMSTVIPHIIAPTYDKELSRTLTLYIRILAPMLVIVVLLAVFHALLKANSHFVTAESVSIVQSVIQIGLIVLFGRAVGANILAVSFVAYSIVNLLYLGLYSRRYWSITKGNPFVDENVRALVKMMLPMMFGYAMLYINQQVDKIVVSGLGTGMVTSLHYAATLSNFVTAFIGSTLSVVFISITKYVSAGEHRQAADTAVYFGGLFTSVCLPISILAVMNAQDIVKIVYERGAFDRTASASATAALRGYVCMFVPLVFRELFSRLQYAYQESRRPVINSSIGIACNIVLNIILSRFWGVFGVTIATSLSVLVTAVLNIVTARRLNSHVSFASYRRYLPLWIAGAAVCVLIIRFETGLLAGWRPLFRFLTVSVTTFAGYGLVMLPVLLPLLKRRAKKAKA